MRFNRDLATAVLAGALAGGYLLDAQKIPVNALTSNGLSPRVYPSLLGWVLLFTSVALGVRSQVATTSGGASLPARDDTGGEAANGRSGRSLAYVAAFVLITVAYLWVLKPLGFVLATAPYVAMTMCLVDGFQRYRGPRLLIPVGSGALASLAMYWLFADALGVLLPGGLFDPSLGT